VTFGNVRSRSGFLPRGNAIGDLAVALTAPIWEAAMPDNLKERAPQDASRISLGEDWEVRYWTRALGVSEDWLREVVRQHGNSVAAIRRALGR